MPLRSVGRFRPAVVGALVIVVAAWPVAAGQRAEIKRDSMGVPHCYGETPAAMMYAHGYAQAEDHLDAMLRGAVTFLGRSAEFFGADHVQSDIGWRFLGGRREIDAHLDEIGGESLELAAAFAAGIDAYRLTHPGEAGWAAALELDAIDVLAGVRAGTLDRQLLLVKEKLGRIGQTTCPSGTQSGASADASNMWAIAPAMSATGVTQIQADPHLPFDDEGTGGTHWYEVHLKSGPYDIIGAGRFGFPGIGIGANADLAYSSTNNGADNADVYEISVRDDPQRPGEFEYRHDGVWKDIEHVADEIIKVAGAADRTVGVRRTHHGVVVYPVPLSAGAAWAARASGQDVFDQFQQHLELNRARTLADVKATMARMNFSFRNFMVATRGGDIWTISYSRHPNRPPGVCFGLPMDGTTSTTDWRKIGGSVLVPFDDLPQIENPSCGWMQNANNMPWFNSCGLTPASFPSCPAGLCNPGAGEGYRSQVASDYFDAKATSGQRITDADMVAMAFNTEVRSADAFIPMLDAAYAAVPPTDPNGVYALAKGALDAWNRRADRTEVGATLYGDWVIDFTSASSVSYTRPPAVLTPAQQQAAVQAFTNTVGELVAAYGTPLVPYGDVHTIKRSGEVDQPSRIPPIPRPVGGGSQSIQTLRMAAPKPDDPVIHGRGNVSSGSSYMMLSTFTPAGVVSARRVRPYGNSMHPGSPHYADMTDFYSVDEFVPFPLTDAEVDVDMEAYSSFDYVPVVESRIPGSRRLTTTCAIEWTVENPTNRRYRDRKGFKSIRQTCTDGDPACDYDGAADGQCSFRLSLCMNNVDPRLTQCAAADVSVFELRRPRPDSVRPGESAAATVLLDAVRSLAPGAASTWGRHQNVVTYTPAVTNTDECSPAVALVVPLRNGTKTGKLRIRTRATNALATRKDSDRLLLRCES